MTKVAFYDTKPYDKTWFKPLAEKMNLDITFFEARLNKDTAILATGNDAVCIFVNDEADKDTLDILYKQGKTCEAFSYYRKALKKDAPEYVRIEGADRVLKDLKDGSSYIRSFGGKQDLTEFLDAWLGKYESLEEITELLKAIV